MRARGTGRGRLWVVENSRPSLVEIWMKGEGSDGW
jgi:hypothetical protein